MKFIIFTFFCFATIIGISQEEKIATSHLSNITIYTMGAMVTETGSINLNKGTNKIVINNIARAFDPKMLLLQFGDKAKVVSLTCWSQDNSILLKDPIYKTVMDSIEILERLKQNSASTIAGYNGEKRMLDDNRVIGGANNGVSNIELQKAMDFYRTKIQEINQLLLNATKLERELIKIHTELHKRKAKLERDFREHNNIIAATIICENAANENFELSYFVNECGWAPFYDVKISDITKPINLTYHAKMYNNTGVSWNDVILTVSTADPSKSALYPKLERWYLGESNNEGVYNYRANKDKLSRRVNKLDSAVGEQRSDKPTTTIQATELSIDFLIAGKKTIPNDARPYLVEINSFDITPNYNYIAIPKLDKMAYLTCGIIDWEQYNLMEGPVNVFYGKTFIGTSYIAPHLAGDTLEVSLGRDSKVMLKYERKKEYTRKSILGNTLIQSFTYEITIRNTNSKDINVNLFDQVPLSRTSDISIDVDEISKADWNKEDGKLQWNTTVKAGEAVKYIVSFTVKSPKGRPIQVTKYKAVTCPTF